MDSLRSIASIGTAGILAASDRFERSAERTANGTGDLATEIVERVQAKTAFDASAMVVKTGDRMQKRLLDIKA